jgi:ubiquinone/menaquinone biosynthesis C-methylase UbiE
MNEELIEILCCPCCGAALDFQSNGGAPSERLVSRCGRSFSVVDGIPNLVYPVDQSYLNESADTYERDMDFVARLLDVDQERVRRSLTQLLDLGRNAHVLEVACGPGSNLPHLIESVGPQGRVYALDISPDMVRTARRKVDDCDAVAFMLGNGCYLPFADASVDALLHVGTLNRFDDIGRALAEMVRVVKVGGTVVAADEGVAPWLKDTEYGHVLSRFGTLFEGSPPLAAIPARARDVTVRWLPGQAYFAITLRVGESAPRLNVDVKLPGRTETVGDVIDSVRRRQS